MNRLALLLLLALVGCTYNRFDPLATHPNQTWTPTHTIGELTPGNIAQTVVVEGVVTSNDSTGNFYKELLIEHEGVLRISVGLYDLYALYARGTTVAVRIDPDAQLERADDGVPTLTLLGNVNGLGETIHRQPHSLPWNVPWVALDELEHVASGSTVQIEGAHFVAGGLFSGEATIEQQGATAQLVTSPYASFAEEPLPIGRFDLRGVVVDGKLKITDPTTDLIPW